MKKKVQLSVTSVIVFSIVLFLAAFSIFQLPANEVKEVTYSEFQQLVKDKKIENIEMSPSEPNKPLVVKLKDNSTVYAPNPESETFKEEMLAAGISVEKNQPSGTWGFIIQIAIMIGIFFFIMSIMSKKTQNPTIQQDKKMMKKAIDPNKRKAKFTDVAGISNAKDDLWEVVTFLKNPKHFLEAGARPPRGVLLYGPPGTGKTLLARAVAGEAGVPFFAVSGSDFVEKFVGVGASRVREIFEEARKVSPAIIFIDEFDALAKDRSRLTNSENEQTLNQFLVEMDGFANNEGIIILASTNRKDHLDPAALRPGRFDRHIEVELPDADERLEILKIHSRNKKLGADVNLTRLAKQCAGFSGAKLEHLMNESALMSIRNNHPKVTWEDVQHAFETIIIGPKRKKSNWSAHEQQVVAYHEAGHAIVTHLLAKQPIERITVDPAGRAGGYVMRKPKDNMLKTEVELYHDICIAMAGRAAESIIFGKENVTTGAQQDFRQASQTALQMVFVYGMSELGALAIPSLDDNMWNRLSDDIKNKAYAEMDKIMKKAEKETLAFLEENKDLLHRLSLHLLKVRTVDGDNIDDVLNGDFDVEEPVTTGKSTVEEEIGTPEGVSAFNTLNTDEKE